MVNIVIFILLLLTSCSNNGHNYKEVPYYESVADRLAGSDNANRATIFPERVYRDYPAGTYMSGDRDTYAPHPSSIYNYSYPYYNPKADNEYYAPSRYAPFELEKREVQEYNYYNYNPYADNPSQPTTEKRKRLFDTPAFE